MHIENVSEGALHCFAAGLEGYECGEKWHKIIVALENLEFDI